VLLNKEADRTCSHSHLNFANNINTTKNSFPFIRSFIPIILKAHVQLGVVVNGIRVQILLHIKRYIGLS